MVRQSGNQSGWRLDERISSPARGCGYALAFRNRASYIAIVGYEPWYWQTLEGPRTFTVLTNLSVDDDFTWPMLDTDSSQATKEVPR